MAKEKTIRHNGIPIAHTFKPSASELATLAKKKDQDRRITALETKVDALTHNINLIMEALGRGGIK